MHEQWMTGSPLPEPGYEATISNIKLIHCHAEHYGERKMLMTFTIVTVTKINTILLSEVKKVWFIN